MAQRIEHWPLDRLIPLARNPRTHSDEQVAQIAASIAEFGFLNPILVDTKASILGAMADFSPAAHFYGMLGFEGDSGLPTSM